MYALVDGNNFFVSCERIFDLSLRGKPVAVLSNNDGCVVSRSNEFKALGIPMGTPFFELRNRMLAGELVLRSSNYELYGDISRRIIHTLGEFSTDVEQYSVDEAFIKTNQPSLEAYFDFGRHLRHCILQWIGIPCGIGFAPTKTLAKIANHIGKKLPDGVFVMPDNPREVLQKTPVEEVWGIGRRLAPQLTMLGIATAYDLACADENAMRRKFSIMLVKTILELRGQPMLGDENPEDTSQSITHSRCFGHQVTDFEELAESIASYTANAAVKLRGENQIAAGINIYSQYYPEYKPVALAGGYSAITVMFNSPTASTSDMLRAITPHLRKLFIAGRRYKKTGVTLFGLESNATRQMELFADEAGKERDNRVYAAVDALNRKFGRKTIFNLSEGIQRNWTMKRERLSPAYTSNWRDLPVVKCK